jgi:hypothetical protein
MHSLNPLIKRACLIFAVLFFVSVPIVWISLFFTTYQGDLTRVGKWLESDFGAGETQQAIDTKLLVSSRIQDADILVIGDSFSENLYWQTQLSKSGKNVATIHWGAIGFICEDLPIRLKESGFKGQQIIIQSVERVAENQFEKSVNCVSSKQITFDSSRTSRPTDTSFTGETFNINGQFLAGLETLYHSAAIRLNPDYSKIHNFKSTGTHIQAIKDGCLYFTNRLCHYGLFFHEDFKRTPLNSKTIKNIKILKTRLNTYKTTWVVIPNKSSIYSDRALVEQANPFWVNLEEDQLGPNLYRIIQNNKSLIKNLYAPNDSHFSIEGYLYIGGIINQDLR